MRTLILYVFHEITDNVLTFLRRGLVDDPNKIFIFIYNYPIYTPDPLDNLNPLMYEHANVRLYLRPNIGHDFQGWNSALFLPVSCLDHKIIRIDETKPIFEPYLHTLFDQFVFINSTVAGPYLPLYVSSDWVDCFTSQLSDEVKITGISLNFMGGKYDPSIGSIIKAYYDINVYDHIHIQSTVFGLDREGLDILLRYKLFQAKKQFPKDKWILICSSEIAISTLLRYEGKSLYSYRMEQGLIKSNQYGSTTDIWHNPNLSLPLNETMFVKTNIKKHIFPEKHRYDSV